MKMVRGRTLIGCRKCLRKVISKNQELVANSVKMADHLKVIRQAADPRYSAAPGEFVSVVMHPDAPESGTETLKTSVLVEKPPKPNLPPPGPNPAADPARLKRHKRETFLHDRGVQLGQVEPLMAVHPEVQHGPTPDDES
jgi:hypothetical protein